MKRLITAACAALMLSACASTPPEPAGDFAIDGNYVHTVETHARRMGVRVQWVNPPFRQRTAAPAPTRHTFRPGGDPEDADPSP